MQSIKTTLFGPSDYDPIPQNDNLERNELHHDSIEMHPEFQPSPQSSTSCWEDWDTALTLSRKERAIGFVILFALGWFLSISTLSSYQNIFTHPRTFALWYTIGSVLALASNFFLYGPVNHVKSMVSSTHRLPTFIYLVGIAMTIIALTQDPVNVRFLIFAVIFQLCGSIIFTLSYLLSGVCGKALFWFFSDKYSTPQRIE